MTPEDADATPAPLVLHQAGVGPAHAPILAPLSLTLAPGEFVGLLGPNGAGKSTLLGLLNATVQPRTGTVHLFGVDAWHAGERRRTALRRRLGTVLQHNEFNPLVPLRGRDVVRIARTARRGLLGGLHREDQTHIDQAIARLGVTALAQRPYRSLSGGERQKFHLARALAQQPDVLLLDEPTTGLDLDWQQRLVDEIAGIYRETDITVVMTTHLTAHLPACCTRVLLLRDGHLLADGAPDDVLTEDTLSTLYNCPVEVVEHQGRLHCYSRGETAS